MKTQTLCVPFLSGSPSNISQGHESAVKTNIDFIEAAQRRELRVMSFEGTVISICETVSRVLRSVTKNVNWNCHQSILQLVEKSPYYVPHRQVELVQTSRHWPKSAPYLRLKNSKRTSICQSIGELGTLL